LVRVTRFGAWHGISSVLDASLAAIQRHPLAYPIVFGRLRRAVLRRFPYSVIYDLSGDEILIVACIHGRRDPKRWQDRS
jgi:plasmid stabilization system protein ParE